MTIKLNVRDQLSSRNFAFPEDRASDPWITESDVFSIELSRQTILLKLDQWVSSVTLRYEAYLAKGSGATVSI
jgi:hypothetical protein